MKNKTLEQLKNRLELSEKTVICLALFSFLYLAGCLALTVPVFRNLVIVFGGFLARHPLNYPVWRERLISWSFSGTILYVLFFIVFFSKNIFTGKNFGTKKYPYLFVILSLLAGVFVIMFRANWTFGDDHEYITTTAINKYVPFHYYITGGRFDPLGHFHYNIPLFVFRLLGINSGLPVEAHFMLIALFYSLSVICLFSLFNRLEPVKGHFHPAFSVFFACTFVLLNRTFCTVFMDLIYPETQVIMLFSVFMFTYYRALETDKKRYYIAAFMVAVYNSYCKEPVFGAFLVIALSNLLFRYKNQSKREKIFYAALIANGLLFIVMYYFISFRNSVGFYNEGRVDIRGLQFIISILEKTPLLIVMILFGLCRFAAIIIKKDRGHLYYDGLLFAGIAYMFAYIILHLNAGYYFLPSIILFLPSLVYWIKYLYQTKKQYALPAFGLIMMFYFFNAGRLSRNVLNTWQARGKFIPYISSLLSEYNEGKKFIWYESDNTVTDNTFYKAIRAWRKYVENAFLNYKNNSEGKEFFTVSKNMDEVRSYKNVLFFYPADNDQNQSMPDELAQALKNNNFKLFVDFYGILIYRQY
ncbi:MAG: hypothetical protein LBP60_03885 [Spirochaetaceae bacterium]|nr:hypothetical protein [Spirochaetaceae bacterium]